MEKFKKLGSKTWPFAAVFSLWFYFYHVFFFPTLVQLIDAEVNAIYTNHFLNQISFGSYPFWNPFTAWGRAEDFCMRLIGDANPFLYIPLVLKAVKVPFTAGYSVFLVSYLIAGWLGFYLLAKNIFAPKSAKENRWPFFAMALFVFTGFGGNIFNDILTILVIIPIIWFFYFLTSFQKDPNRFHAAGIFYCLAIIVTTYIPYFFVTVFLLCFLLGIFLYPQYIKDIVVKTGRFIKTYPLTSLLLCVFLSIFLLPGYLFFLESRSGENYYSWRGAAPGQNPLALSFDFINAGSPGGMPFYGAFTWIKRMSPGIFYVPVEGFLIFFLGVLLPLRRKVVFLFVAVMGLFFLSLGDATSLHRFLYDHVGYFQSFRNLHFFFFFGMGFGALLCAHIIKEFCARARSSTRPVVLWEITNTFIHLAAWGYVWSVRSEIVVSIFIVIVANWILWSWAIMRGIKTERDMTVFMAGIFCFVLMTGAEAFYIQRQNYKRFGTFTEERKPYARAESRPVFTFLRGEKAQDAKLKETRNYGNAQDTSGFIDGEYNGTRWSNILLDKIPERYLREYVRHKFVLYDETQAWEESSDEYWIRLAMALRLNAPLAVVADKNATKKSEPIGPVEFITGESERLKVLDFNVNALVAATNFPKEKFLVYNDSFHSGWRARIDGKVAPLQRANFSFKGLWIPSGRHTVCFRFRSLPRHILSWVIMGLSDLFLIFLVITAWRRRKRGGQLC